MASQKFEGFPQRRKAAKDNCPESPRVFFVRAVLFVFTETISSVSALRLCAFAGNFVIPIALLPENFFD